ncbi:MAG: winged helix-turn-helix transcriptional regulator [Deltaproteobacteria bacterium]|nr:winged helix-turn-helix transcriptional regulator [Deltaproteobacteria bacterium]
MTEKEDQQLEQHAAELLELFYPVHYRGNMAVEDAMRGKLTRKEAAIMWLIRSAGEDGSEMRRKEIVARLQDWFDVSSPAVTKALRHMSRPPLSLVRLLEDAASGREKRVRLTPQGQRFVLGMVARGQEFLRRVVRQLPDHQVRDGIEFLRAGVAAYEHIHAERPHANGKNLSDSLRRHGGDPAHGVEVQPASHDGLRSEDEPDQVSRSPM